MNVSDEQFFGHLVSPESRLMVLKKFISRRRLNTYYAAFYMIAFLFLIYARDKTTSDVFWISFFAIIVGEIISLTQCFWADYSIKLIQFYDFLQPENLRIHILEED